MMLESKNHISMQQRASIMKMGRRLESWLILQIRGKLPIEKKNSQITRRRNLHLWRWPESQASSAATAVRNNREGSGAIWLLGDNGAINVRLRRKNRDCCLNCKPGFLVSLWARERETAPMMRSGMTIVLDEDFLFYSDNCLNNMYSEIQTQDSDSLKLINLESSKNHN